MKHKSIQFGFVLLLSIGCSVGPDYTTPEIPMPANYPAVEGTVAEAPKDLSSWWRVFGDEELTKLVEEGLKENNDVSRALARINESRMLRRQEQLDLMPSLTPSASFTSTRLGPAQVPGLPANLRRQDIYEAGFDTLWEIDIFGQQRRLIEAAEAEEEASKASLDDTLRSLSSEIARTYFELRGAQKQLQVAEENLKIQQDTVNVIEARLKFGEATDLDIAWARTQFERTRATIPSLQAQTEGSIRRISVLVGKQPSALLSELSQPKPLPMYQGAITIGSPAELLRRRPDVRTAERKLAAATARIGAAVADFFPKVEFTGSLSVQARNFGELSDSGHETFRFGPSITWHGLNVSQLVTRIRVQDARTEQAARDYAQSILLALEDTENALVRFGKERERRVMLERAREQSQHAVQLAKAQYQEGQIEFLSLLEAQRTALETEREFTDSETSASTALVTVFKALGGGWEGFELTKKE